MPPERGHADRGARDGRRPRGAPNSTAGASATQHRVQTRNSTGSAAGIITQAPPTTGKREIPAVVDRTDVKESILRNAVVDRIGTDGDALGDCPAQTDATTSTAANTCKPPQLSWLPSAVKGPALFVRRTVSRSN